MLWPLEPYPGQITSPPKGAPSISFTKLQAPPPALRPGPCREKVCPPACALCHPPRLPSRCLASTMPFPPLLGLPLGTPKCASPWGGTLHLAALSYTPLGHISERTAGCSQGRRRLGTEHDRREQVPGQLERFLSEAWEGEDGQRMGAHQEDLGQLPTQLCRTCQDITTQRRMGGGHTRPRCSFLSTALALGAWWWRLVLSSGTWWNLFRSLLATSILG